MRKPLIAGNWKMYHTPSSGEAMLKELAPLVKDAAADVVICAPATHLAAAVSAAADSGIRIGAENMHWEQEGAFTGEISAPMLLDLKVEYVILGHSERREYFGETDETVSRKGETAVKAGLIPIVCVGETKEQREAGEALALIEKQIAGSLAFWNGEAEIVIAYEPVWAIGTGLTATAEDAEEVIAHIRSLLAIKYGSRAEEIRILYGGSVKPATIADLMAKPNIDGALVGGASLKAQSFGQIVNY
jgi:triosephosphate isomerase